MQWYLYLNTHVRILSFISGLLIVADFHYRPEVVSHLHLDVKYIIQSLLKNYTARG